MQPILRDNSSADRAITAIADRQTAREFSYVFSKKMFRFEL